MKLTLLEAPSVRVRLPSVEEEGEPEAVKLIWNVGVEEGQQATHIIQTVDLQKTNQGVHEHMSSCGDLDTNTH